MTPMPQPDAYQPADDRYDARRDGWFRRCGKSGLKLPAVSLGYWHNYGAPGTDSARHGDEASMHENARRITFAAFDHGITHHDFDNNYGPPPGSAEERFGRILRDDLAAHRDELVISTKAGYLMWPGPYGDFGSRKYLLASLDQSLKRLGVEYVDIFYHHRPDFDTPLEETMGALDSAVKQGKALYAGVSNYPADLVRRAMSICDQNGLTRPIIHQPRYNLFDRFLDESVRGRGSLVEVCGDEGMGMIAFSPLAQGLLSDKYLDGIPPDSRAANEGGFLKKSAVSDDRVAQARQLQEIARDRGQSLVQLALAWVLRDGRVTSALIGASRPEQVVECCRCLDAGPLDDETLGRIAAVVSAN